MNNSNQDVIRFHDFNRKAEKREHMPRENMTKEYKKSGLVSTTGDKFVIRMPEGLREKLRQRAEQNRRSMNSEIVSMLEKFFEE